MKAWARVFNAIQILILRVTMWQLTQQNFIVAGLGSQGLNISDLRWRFTDFKYSSLYLIDYPLFLITILENVKTER